MLCSELPGGVLWTGAEDADSIAPEGGVELVHGSPGAFPLLSVQFAPKGRLSVIIREHNDRLAFEVRPKDTFAAHVEVVAIDQAEDLAHGSATRQ